MKTPRSLPLAWPEHMPSQLTNLLVDCHMISHLESKPWSDIREYQNRRIGQLLKHGSKNSDWWRKRIGNFTDGQKLNFSQLQPMTRADLRESIASAGGPLPVPPGHGAIGKAATSGSSGVPLQFYYSALSGRLNGAHYWLDRKRRGIDSRKLVARFSVHLEEHSGPHVLTGGSNILDRAPEYQRRAQQFTIEEHAQWIKEIAPSYVVAHPTILAGIMDVLESDPARPRIDSLLTYAETVTIEFRRRAKAIFGAKTADRYSSQELGPLAFQCPLSDDHYHIASTSVRLEVLNDLGRPCVFGEIGRLHATGLQTFANPIVRYELGDLASMLPHCVCGHSHPVLTNLLGRERFLLKMPDGSRRYVNFGARHWLKIAPLNEARIVQYTSDVITAEYVLDRDLTESEHQAFLLLLKTEISPDVKFQIVRLAQIAWGPSYKRQDVVSLI